MRAIILMLAVVALAGCDKQNAGNSQANQAAAAPASLSGGLDRSHAGAAAPATTFKNPDGDPTSLADFRGKPVLMNLWATWCAPCVKELPTLAAMAAKQTGLEVLALSQDMQPQPTVAAFLDERKIALEPYQDAEMEVSTELGISTLPTSVLYGSDGKEIWRYTGDLDWTGPEAAALLKEAR
jgi:thiol-disulfide isomerase/thioredoxin